MSMSVLTKINIPMCVCVCLIEQADNEGKRNLVADYLFMGQSNQ